MVTIIKQANYLLDQLIKSLEQKFINEGGYSENLTKKRLWARKNDDVIRKQKQDEWLEKIDTALKENKTVDEALIIARSIS